MYILEPCPPQRRNYPSPTSTQRGQGELGTLDSHLLQLHGSQAEPWSFSTPRACCNTTAIPSSRTGARLSLTSVPATHTHHTHTHTHTHFCLRLEHLCPVTRRCTWAAGRSDEEAIETGNSEGAGLVQSHTHHYCSLPTDTYEF